MPRGYDRSETSAHHIAYHFVWCPKYRRKLLRDLIAVRCKELILEKCAALGCNVKAIEVMPDHVHVFLETDTQTAPNSLVGQIKGYTSHELRLEFPEIKTRLPTLWTRSYFCSTHGHINDKMIQIYIEDQRGI